MPLIRCTAKLIREVGVKPDALQDGGIDNSLLGQWHANLLHIDRRKSLLFVNDRTLFNFIVPDVSRSQVRNLPELFRFHLSCVLSAENLPAALKARVLTEYEHMGIGRSSDRSVLGSANELAFHYKCEILEAGGVHSPRVPTIIRELNRMPLQAIHLHFPIDQLRAVYNDAA